MACLVAGQVAVGLAVRRAELVFLVAAAAAVAAAASWLAGAAAETPAAKEHLDAAEAACLLVVA